ncbi:MAG: hypothetical protein HC875_34820, partial [Anaerolineales bacterium]|nr:hypothetical protein [Anaerolineales bacterium]
AVIPVFFIYEPKRRLVSAAPFRDRVVHHALCRVIEPIWEARFISTSFACRVGKGTHKALDQAHAWVRQYRYAFQGDIVKYFPSIDHQILRSLLAHHIADRQTMGLIDVILESGAGLLADEYPMTYFPGDDLFAATRPRGLPIGNLTSQFWANVYLHPLDMFVKQELRCPAYVRYMDDFVLFSDDKAQLRQWSAAVRDFLAGGCGWCCIRSRAWFFRSRSGWTFAAFGFTPLTAACAAAPSAALCSDFSGSGKPCGAGNCRWPI